MTKSPQRNVEKSPERHSAHDSSSSWKPPSQWQDDWRNRYTRSSCRSRGRVSLENVALQQSNSLRGRPPAAIPDSSLRQIPPRGASGRTAPSAFWRLVCFSSLVAVGLWLGFFVGSVVSAWLSSSPRGTGTPPGGSVSTATANTGDGARGGFWEVLVGQGSVSRRARRGRDGTSFACLGSSDFAG